MNITIAVNTAEISEETMKKLLSTLLMAAMLLCMIPALGVSAADYTSIDSVEEWLAFAAACNDGSYTNNADHKVTVDLDFTGVNAEDVVIKKQVGDLALNFQGHTVSGIVREVTSTGHVSAGLLCDYANGFAEFLNVKLKDCSLTVNVASGFWGLVGGVVGETDRVYVNGVEMENVTIKVTGTGSVGAVYGHKQYNDYRSGDSSVVLKNVLIDAPNANVGIIVGRQGGNDGAKINVTKMEVSNTTLKGSNNPAADTYVAQGVENASLTVKDGVTPNVTLVDNATGYQPPKAEPAAPVVPDSWGYEGFEDHHGNNDVYYVMWVDGAECWTRMKGNGSGDYPDMDNNKYYVIIDGTEYECTYLTMFDGGEWGYLRFKLTGTDFKAKFNTEYTVNWRVEAKDGSWAYVGEDADILCFCGETPKADAITGDGLTAIQGMTNLNGKVNQDSVSTDVDTYNDTTETEKSVFDGNLTNKMGSHDTDVTITWSTTEAVTVTDYVMVTGNDVENNSSRNPMLWTLYGSNDGKTWVVLDTVNYAGFEAANSTAYGFHVDNPGAYTEYKLVLKSKGGFELGEMTLYSNPAPAPQPPVTDKPAQTGDMTALVASMATLALIGTAVIVSKKRNYN